MTSYGEHPTPRRHLNKAPEVTISFWIVTILATAAGQSFTGLLVNTVGLGLTRTTMVMTTVLGGVMVVQLRAERHVPALYWLVVTLISIVGTLIGANLTDTFDVSPGTATIVFAALLAGTFAVWYAKERTLSLGAIDTPGREAFYWLAILFTFVLGAAVGDVAAEALNLGYGAAVTVFALAVAAIEAARRFLGLATVTAFWLAYTLAHPLTADLGDLLSQPTDAGGLGIGTPLPGLVFLAAIVAIIAHLTASRRNPQPHHTAAHDPEDRSS
ncbi:hypothetical protein [Actinoplanes sp. NPDC020271]|uniref:hypothetical protein n=1 Tax=Actinoplanes sp. NPDC020271 TaxID=3363896 RepID=UPI0037ABA6EA